MAIEIDSHIIEKGLLDLFKYAFTSNCSLDDASVTSDESKTLEELDSSEMLNNFKELVMKLLNFKRDYQTSDKGELVHRSEQFEALLQKLEAEVRVHIRVENQLKLHIESHINRIVELEKLEEDYQNKIKELEDKAGFKKTQRTSDIDKQKKEFEEKINNLLDTIEKREKNSQKFETDNNRLKLLLEEKNKECEVLKKKVTRLNKINLKGKELQNSSSADYLKKKVDFSNTQPKITQKANVDIKEIVRREIKSLGEGEINKLLASVTSSPDKNKDPNNAVKKEEAKASGTAKKPRGHIKSVSDQKIVKAMGAR